ncbi:hypothetical protein A6046_05885 [[Haemophilus] ducreyi]|uniref:Intracellular septation protein A n=2 Tax=Haemophilus ducreyi TaxID=730 RepID=Q7VKZ0_HAEDU|nr:hypothetical protein [[Haemophilus] ducreyi]AAP96473.1 hypothetical protein HD_1713 [[Haemophilus] ducreyi 35000HP]AKO31339.1 hypothetical protein RY60_06580 [[Haemophilus] ducreyi]AKO32788.1 hypothetical protein RZ57_06650 [[Haemophilus] ducreyi]AKO34238.1 hypothetical protein RZ58_06640 [[Haemophilus] ducreyi]AKO35681.1 hypothetical protein RZ59_06570 [[Haemophilus] ducreyi]
MPIKFANLFQDSWNFIRNQHTFSLFAFILLVLLQIANMLFLPKMTIEQAQAVSNPQLLVDFLPIMLLGVVDIFLGILFILNIKRINEGSFQHFFQPLAEAGRKLLPVVLLNILMVLPLSIVMSFQLLNVAKATNPMLGIMSFVLVIVGFWVLIRLSLASYAYLLEDINTVSEAVRFTWQLTKDKIFPVMLFCVISYFATRLLAGLEGQLATNMVGMALNVVANAFVTLFTAVFSFRFYQVYRQVALRG